MFHIILMSAVFAVYKIRAFYDTGILFTLFIFFQLFFFVNVGNRIGVEVIVR